MCGDCAGRQTCYCIVLPSEPARVLWIEILKNGDYEPVRCVRTREGGVD